MYNFHLIHLTPGLDGAFPAGLSPRPRAVQMTHDVKQPNIIPIKANRSEVRHFHALFLRLRPRSSIFPVHYSRYTPFDLSGGKVLRKEKKT